eukprot:SAG11_NODE_3350_length_2507_cov_3.084302_3_plen_58_part_00
MAELAAARATTPGAKLICGNTMTGPYGKVRRRRDFQTQINSGTYHAEKLTQRRHSSG